MDDALLYESIRKLDSWLERREYKGYEPFDGLKSFLRPLTLQKKFPRQLLVQLVLRSPFNLRPLLGIRPERSTKGMGYIAKGYLRLFNATGRESYRQKALMCLDWLVENSTKGYSGFCWGNHFDYQARGAYFPKYSPTVVWVSLIAHTFLDAYDILGDENYLDVAGSCCRFIMNDLPREVIDSAVCISYLPSKQLSIHNSNMLAASILARTFQKTREEELSNLALAAMAYSAGCQMENGAWFYGEDPMYHWIDNWHTAYNLDSLKWFLESANDDSYMKSLKKGFLFYVENFFEEDGAPKYYHNHLYPIDIQCCAQAIDTLCFFADTEQDALALAQRVALWTIANLQDEDGYFYFRRLRYIKAKTPMLHWGQGTMLSALAHLYLKSAEETL